MDEYMRGEVKRFDPESRPANWIFSLPVPDIPPTTALADEARGAGATAAVRNLGSCSVIRKWPAGPGSSLAAARPRPGDLGQGLVPKGESHVSLDP